MSASAEITTAACRNRPSADVSLGEGGQRGFRLVTTSDRRMSPLIRQEKERTRWADAVAIEPDVHARGKGEGSCGPKMRSLIGSISSGRSFRRRWAGSAHPHLPPPSVTL